MADPAIKKARQQLQIIMEGADDVWIFEPQPNLPRIGEYAAITDKDWFTVIESRVVDIRW